MINLQNIITPYQNLDNLSNFFIVVLISVLFSIAIYAVFHFICELLSKKIFSFKNIGPIKKIFIYQFIGFVLSAAIIPLYYLVDQSLNSNAFALNTNLYLVSMQVIIFMVAGIFISHWILVGVFPIFLLANNLYLFSYHNDNAVGSVLYMIVFYIINYLFTLVSNILLKRSEANDNKSYWLFIGLPIFGLILFIIVRFIGLLILNEQNNQNLWSIIFINILVNWLLFLVLFATGSLIKKIIDSTFNLKESVMYDNEIFVNNGYSKQAFETHVRTKKIKTGLFITLEFKHENEIYAENREVTKLLIEKLKEFMKVNFEKEINSFFFKTRWNQYGLFYEINARDLNLGLIYQNNYKDRRSKLDFFNNLESKFNDFSKNPIIYNNKEYIFNTLCFISIYGIHSNFFDRLVSYNQKLENHWISKEYKNNIKVFNFKDIDDNTNRIDFKKIKAFYQLDKAFINLNLSSIKELKSNRSKSFLMPGLIWIEKYIYNFQDIYKEISSIEDASLIIRNFALRTLNLANEIINQDKNEKYKKSYLVINYPIFHLCQKNFSNKNILKKIENTQVNKNRIILNFSFIKFDLMNNLELFFTNLKKIQNQGINIAFSNIDSFLNDDKKNRENKKIYELIIHSQIKFNPDYIFVNDNSIQNEILKKNFKNSGIFKIY